MSIWFYLLFPAFFLLVSLAFKIDDWVHQYRRKKRGYTSSYYDSDTTFPGFIVGFGSLVGIVLILMLGVPRFNFNTVEYEYKSTNIESITLNSKVSGEAHFAFTIGYAYIDETPVYYFYENSPLGGMKLNSVSANHSVLIETDDVTPHVEIVDKIRFKDPNFWAKLLRTKRRLYKLGVEGENYYSYLKAVNHDGTISWKGVPQTDQTIIKLYVPTGTIKKQFDVNTMNL